MYHRSNLRKIAGSQSRLVKTVLLIFSIAFFTQSITANDNSQENPKQTIKQADKLVRKGDLVGAEKLLRDYLAKDASDVSVKLNLSQVLLKQRRLIESYELSFSVAKDNPNNAFAYTLVGMALLNAGNFSGSKPIFYRAANLTNKIALLWAGLGMLDFYENRIDESINKLEEASFLDPNEPDFIFALGQVYARAERYTEAADAYNRFLQISPKSDFERRDRIRGLVSFLRYLGNKQELYRIGSNAKQTILPFQLLRDRPIIEIGINGKKEKLRFVLDTGSGISVISDETAKRLKIEPVSRGGQARAVGGSGKFDIIYGFLRSMELGDVKIKNVPVYIRKFHDDAEKIDGYMGLSLISKFLTTVDYGNKTFTLTRKDSANLLGSEKNVASFPLRLTSSGFLSGEVQLGGMETAVNFIVDTGASISVISTELANSAEMSKFSIDEKMRVIGAAGITENVKSYMIPKVTFGTHTREQVKAVSLDLDIINEAAGFEQAGILGGNFLKNYRMTFDFQNSRVTFIPIVDNGSRNNPKMQ